MSLDAVETLPNTPVISLAVPNQLNRLLASTMEGCGLHLRIAESIENVEAILNVAENVLVFVGGEDVAECQGYMAALLKNFDPKSALMVACVAQGDQSSHEIMAQGATDVLDPSLPESVLLRRCNLYLELLQRRNLSSKEQQLIGRLAYQKERLLSLLPDGILYVSNDGYISDLNEAAMGALGYGPEELVGAHLSQILCEPNSSDPLLDWCEHPLYSAMATQQDAHTEDTGMWRSDGSMLPVDCEIGVLYPGQEPEYILIFQDISIRKTEEAELNQLTRYDPVTGLANVSLMRHFLLKAMARALRNDRRLAVLYIDLDDFHCINESFGMSGGNSLLKSVGRRLKNCIRTGDLVSRYQDDAFMVVLDEVRHNEDVEKVAHQMMEKLVTPHDLSGVPVVAHASIGIAFYPKGSIGIDALIEQATEAMQWIKLHGKNGVRVAGTESSPLPNELQKPFVH